MARRDRRYVESGDDWRAWRDYVWHPDIGPDAIDHVDGSTVRLVLLSLGAFRSKGSGRAPFWATEKILSRKARTSPRQVRRVLKHFDGELLERTRAKGGAKYWYRLLLPESADREAGREEKTGPVDGSADREAGPTGLGGTRVRTGRPDDTRDTSVTPDVHRRAREREGREKPRKGKYDDFTLGLDDPPMRETKECEGCGDMRAAGAPGDRCPKCRQPPISYGSG